MGRSSSSGCLKIVSCGKKSWDDEEFDGIVERKASLDKRGWSFRKRSPRHRVLINTVPTELPASSIKKESPESCAHDFAEETQPPVLGKLSVPRNADDVFPLSPVALSSKAAEVFDDVQTVSDIKPPESVVISIQASARGYLARRELAKVKNVVILQAAIRGHLVRKQAAGTLQCVQAIIKVQALVRANRVRQSVKGLAVHERLEEHKRARKSASILEEEEPGPKPNILSTSSDKMLSSRFAFQLLESAEKMKPKSIICDTEPSYGWSWLERWTSLCAKEQFFGNNAQLLFEHLESHEKNHLVGNDIETSDKTMISHDVLIDNNAKTDEEAAESSLRQLEGDDDLITIDANGFNFHTCGSVELSNESTTPRVNIEQSDVPSKHSDFSSTRKSLQSTPDRCSQSGSVSEYAGGAGSSKIGDTLKNSLNGVVPEKQDNEGRKLPFVSRKSCNPAFAAVQSKFEELSSALASGRKSISIKTDVPVESRLSSVSGPKQDVKVTEVSSSHDTTSCSQRFQIGTSECGTEISISSTLDSPDRFEPERGLVEETVSTIHNEGFEEHGTMQESNSHHPASNFHFTSNTVSLLKEDSEDFVTSSADSAMVIAQLTSSKPVKPDLQIELDGVAEKQRYGPSQQGSPSSHATLPESHGTPSSQVSSGADKRKVENKSTSRRISPSVSKGPSSSQNIDSSERDSMEHLLKDPKDGRRRSSFGSSKPDLADGEHRRNSIPSYMQATESARAKSLVHSPKSSPDIHDKDGYPKKKQHLPEANGKQDSPRLLQQAQAGVKGRSGHSPQEREWRR